MISASLPSEALAQLGQLGQLGHLYPPVAPPPGMAPEFLAPPPRPYGRYPARPRPTREPPAPPSAQPAYPPVPGAYAPFLPHPAAYAPYLYRSRPPQPQPSYPIRPRPTSGFVPPAPAPAPRSPPAPPPILPPSIPEPPASPDYGAPAPYFCRGALIRLEDGSLRRVEEMRTEDFVVSADRSGDLALTQCTLLRLEERVDRLSLTLTYDRNRSQVELESTVEHPFFVYGRGWASFRPERTLRKYNLRVQRLQVGDVCVSLVAKRHAPAAPAPLLHPVPHTHVSSHASPHASPHVSSHVSSHASPHVSSHASPHASPHGAPHTVTHHGAPPPPQTHPENLSVKEDARKRRWSAPEVVDDDRPPLKKR